MTTQDQTGQSGEPTIHCPQCNSIYNSAKKFCGKCGTPLVATIYTPVPLPNSQEQKNTLPEFNQNQPEQPQYQPPGTGSKPIIIAVVITLCISIAGYFAYDRFIAKKGAGLNLLAPSETPAAISKRIITNVYSTASSGDIDGMLSNYSDQVQFLSSGIVDKSFIAKEARAFRKRWNHVRYEMVGEPIISNTSDSNTIEVENEVQFQVQNNKKTVSGTARDYWTIRKEQGQWLIVSFKQTVIDKNKNSAGNSGMNNSETSSNSDTTRTDQSASTPAGMTAISSSDMPSISGLSFHASNILDGNPDTWWSPRKNAQKNWIRIALGREFTVRGIEIHNGSHYKNYVAPDGKNYGDLFRRNLRIRVARLEFSDNSSEIVELEDKDAIQIVSIKPRSTSFVTLVPLSFYPSTTWNDICVSHFKPML